MTSADWPTLPHTGAVNLAEPPPADTLDRLAERMGIESSYINNSGEAVHASPAIKRALLTAMGVDAGDDRAAAASLARIERADLSRPLPPIAVIRASARPFAVALTLPADTAVVRWTLFLENGGKRQGTVRFAELPLHRSAALDGAALETRGLALIDEPPLGYHRLRVETDRTTAVTTVAAVPERCFLPAPLEHGDRLWGLSAQLYSVRTALDWGIGDFGSLASLAEVAAGHGAAVVGLNPLHTLFLDEPQRASPYSPASRLYLSPLYIDVTSVPELMGCADVRETITSPGFQAALEAARTAEMVDYAAVAALKLPVLESLYDHFLANAPEERAEAFAAFRAEQGEPLERLCRFQALRERFVAVDRGMADWRWWPQEYRDCNGPAVERYAAENSHRIGFFAWLQWVADSQLAAASERATGCGMAIGFYRDLAVGADSGGAETWSAPGVVVAGAQVGAPPDLFNPAGQDWGLPPFNPLALRQEAYASFIQLVRANMRHAGAIRIDHAMALQHVYWIPNGKPASEGAYIGYNVEELLGLLALESQRHRCLVVGEDLGTVPPGFRERMTDAGVLSYRVVFFEWEHGRFKAPDAYPYLALSTVGSHDLATLRGWWVGHDIELKESRGLYPAPGEADKQRGWRANERACLIDALNAAGLPLPAGFDVASPYSPALSYAAHAFLARTGSAVAMVQLDELTDELAQVNLPGTVDQYPNWRRKLGLTLEQIAGDELATAIAGILSAARPRR